jgi:hypothetical protein
MSEHLGIKVVQKEGTENTFEVTIHDKSPLQIVSDFKGIFIEDTLLSIILTAQQKAGDHILNTKYC